MSNHGHHHRSHRKKNPIDEFLDRLRGRKRSKHHHRSEFPGINLPKDYDPVAWKDKSRQAKRPSFVDDEEAEGDESAIAGNLPEQAVETGQAKPSQGPSKKKRSIFDALDIYLKQREIRKEDAYRQKIRMKHRRKSEEEFRKINKGPSFGKRLLSTVVETDEATGEKSIPFLSQRSPFYRNMTITVNSLSIFIATYILTYLFYWLTCMLVASFFGLDSILYYYDLKFNDHSPLWDRLNILIITGLPPFLSLILALFLIQIVFKIPRFSGLQKLFILWSSFHLFNHFFGAFPSGIVTDEGFGYVAAWLYLNTAFKFLFSLISLFMLGLIGYLTSKHILETSDSAHRIKGDNRLSFLLFQMALPWFIGTVAMLLLRIPENFNYPYETLMFFSMGFMVFPSFFNEKVKPELNMLKVKKRRSINLGYLAMMVALVLFLRIMLDIGLHFIIEINISISPANM